MKLGSAAVPTLRFKQKREDHGNYQSLLSEGSIYLLRLAKVPHSVKFRFEALAMDSTTTSLVEKTILPIPTLVVLLLQL